MRNDDPTSLLPAAGGQVLPRLVGTLRRGEVNMRPHGGGIGGDLQGIKGEARGRHGGLPLRKRDWATVEDLGYRSGAEGI